MRWPSWSATLPQPIRVGIIQSSWATSARRRSWTTRTRFCISGGSTAIWVKAVNTKTPRHKATKKGRIKSFNSGLSLWLCVLVSLCLLLYQYPGCQWIQPCKHLVRNCADLFCQLFAANFRRLLPSQQDHFIVNFGLDIGHICHGHVHCDATDNGNRLTVNQGAAGVGELAIITIVVADG